MKIDEYEASIQEAIKSPEKAPAVLQTVLKAIREDASTAEAQGTALKEAQEKIRDLQDANVRLFLSATTEKKEEPEPEPELEGQEAIDEFFKKLEQEE